MELNPLEYPVDNQLLLTFLEHARIHPDGDPRGLLRQIAAAFSKLPYENLTKIIKFEETRNIVAARQVPKEILENHFRWGTGGTCFSLTATLLHLVRALGFDAQPILADRSYGPDTHCALLVWLDGQPHLLDPGYLLVDPVPLASVETRSLTTAFNRIDLVGDPQVATKLDLYTIEGSSRKYRLTFKTSPVDAGEFLRAWDASFHWEMMQYPVLSRIVGDRQLYQRGQYSQARGFDSVVRQEIPLSNLPAMISAQFGIDRRIAEKAISLLPEFRG